MPKKLKILAFGLIIILLLAAVGWGTYYFWLRDKETTNNQEYQPSELSVPTDYYAPSIEAIKKSFPSPADQYAQFIQYAYAKETVEKYDEAIALYEAAVESAPDDESKKVTQYTLYLLGLRIQRPELTDKYRQLLGEEWIKQHEQAALDSRRDE